MYLRSYPEWAYTNTELQTAVGTLDECTARRVLEHTCQNQVLRFRQNLRAEMYGTVADMEGVISEEQLFLEFKTADLEIIRRILSTCTFLPMNLLQEAVAIYKWGIMLTSVVKKSHKKKQANLDFSKVVYISHNWKLSTDIMWCKCKFTITHTGICILFGFILDNTMLLCFGGFCSFLAPLTQRSAQQS